MIKVFSFLGKNPVNKRTICIVITNNTHQPWMDFGIMSVAIETNHFCVQVESLRCHLVIAVIQTRPKRSIIQLV